MKFRISPRLALVIIASMFLLPLALAWLMYSGALEFNPVSTRNLGQDSVACRGRSKKL